MNIRKIAAALALSSVFLLTSCGQYSKGDKLVQQAIEYYNDGDYKAALETFSEAEEAGLKKAKPEVLHYYMGEAYFKTGEYEKSILTHRKALDEKPGQFKSLVTIGVCYRKLGDDEEALRVYEEALLYDPENADSVGLYVSLGSLYIARDKPYSAIDYLEKAEEIYPEHPGAHAMLAIAYTMAYEYDKADNELALAVTYRYDNVQAIRDKMQEVKEAHARVPVLIKK